MLQQMDLRPTQLPPPGATGLLRRITTILVVIGALATGLWTMLASFLGGYTEDNDCIYSSGGCDETGRFLGFAAPAWVAFALVIAAFLLARWKGTRLSAFLVACSPFALALIPMPDRSLNEISTMVWLTIVVLSMIAASAWRAAARG
jgi:hypothetical protein